MVLFINLYKLSKQILNKSHVMGTKCMILHFKRNSDHIGFPECIGCGHITQCCSVQSLKVDNKPQNISLTL